VIWVPHFWPVLPEVGVFRQSTENLAQRKKEDQAIVFFCYEL
jgi:hypothetical protein